MKIFAISGSTAAERTQTAQAIAVELERRHRTAALWLGQADSAKDKSPQPSKTIGNNTITFGNDLTLEDYLPYINEEFLISAEPIDMLPKLSLDETADDLTFGKAKDFADLSSLVDFIETAAPGKMPFIFGNSCCKGCKYGSCRNLLAQIIAGEATHEECSVGQPDTHVKINGNELTLVQFGQDIIRHTNQGLLSTLNGYAKNAHIEIEILPQNK